MFQVIENQQNCVYLQLALTLVQTLFNGMKNHVSFLALACLWAALTACNVPQAVVMPPPKGITRFRMNVAMVEVAERNQQGGRWDPGLTDEQMAPDLYYVVSVGENQVYKSATSDNKLLTQWLEKSDAIDVKRGEKIKIAFYDYDTSVARTGMLNNSDDFVGYLELTVDEFVAAAQSGKELSAGLVKKCRITLHNLYR